MRMWGQMMSLTSDIWLNKEKVSTHLLQPALQLKIVEEHSIYIQAGVQKEERRGIYLHDLNILSPVQEFKKKKNKNKNVGRWEGKSLQHKWGTQSFDYGGSSTFKKDRYSLQKQIFERICFGLEMYLNITSTVEKEKHGRNDNKGATNRRKWAERTMHWYKKTGLTKIQ